MIVLGSMFSRPEEVGFSYINIIHNKDFHDPAMAFYHVFFNDYILTYSNEITEAKCNMFASMDDVRMKGYKKFGFFKTIKELMKFGISSDDELKGQVDILKKWSVLRSLNKNGYDVSKILKHPKFNSMSADSCANLVRGGIDKICNQVITGLDDTIDMSANVMSVMDGFLEAPERGWNCNWDFVNTQCSGIMKHDSYCIAMNSNQGKGRSLINLAMHLALVEGANVGFYANEMSFESMRLAGLSVVNNSPAIQKLHGHQLAIPEKRFKSGTYLDNDGNIIYRRTDGDGNFTETVEQFKNRLEKDSKEYRDVKDTMRWFEEFGQSKIWFKNCAENYSDDSLQRLIRQGIYQRSLDVWFYDTLKHGTGSDMSKWSDLVQTTTRLVEMNATLPTAAIMSCQLNKSAHQMKPEDVTDAQLSAATYIFHLFDVMIVLMHLKPGAHKDYVLQIKDKSTGQWRNESLSEDRHWTVANLIKNRRGSKHMYLLDSDLNLNVWTQKNGILIPKETTEKKELLW